MAKYAYAPLSIEEQQRRRAAAANAAAGNAQGGFGSSWTGGGGGGGSSGQEQQHSQEDDDKLTQERMPMCVGICVLLAIVFVLSRTGGDAASTAAGLQQQTTQQHSEQQQQQHTNMRASSSSSSSSVHPQPAGTNAAVPSSTMPVVAKKTTPVTTPADTIQMVPSSSTTTPSESAVATASTAANAANANANPQDACDCPTSQQEFDINLDDPVAASQLMGQLRQQALANTPPHIIECAEAEAGESQAACHLSRTKRQIALGQKGATLWMTGCSGAGKTTIATALEEILVKQYGKHVYRLDGDNLRTGLNRDLGFSEQDRAESVRRTGELATLMADAGVITLVGLISPYRDDRDAVRQRHVDQNIPFYEVFLDVPIAELFERDPKGQYARVKSGELKHFTCIDDPYEIPLEPEIVLKTHQLEISQSANILLTRLEQDGILQGAPKVTPPGLPNPDGDQIIDLHVSLEERSSKIEYAATLPKVLITDIDLNWLQVVGEGWAAPLEGFMREGMLLETLHFNSVLVDPFNITGNVDRLTTPTNFDTFASTRPNQRVSMPIPITLSATEYTKQQIMNSRNAQGDVALVTRMGHTVAIMKNVEIYENRKEEIVARMFGVIDMEHPYIKHIYDGGPYLLGGEIELLDRIRYNDGLDQWRKTSTELIQEFTDKGADTVYAFQTRNPTHAGHAYLMKSAGQDLKDNHGYKNPVLWLSPLGGWTKSDDVPLDVRVKQHEEVLKAGLTHPGGLDPATTVMAIWPSPMVYAGPTEVQFHAKSRRSAGASYFVVGRDPAGMKGSSVAVAHPDDDLYDGNHGRYVLQNSPGIGDMKMLSFVKVMYDTTDNVMKVPEESRMDDFISISGSKMRLLARNGAVPCPPDNIPTDLVEANCVPSGFMVPKGWDIVVDYYKNIDAAERYIPWSQPHVDAPAAPNTAQVGEFGFTTFSMSHQSYDSWWHDVPLRPTSASSNLIINMVTEIPMYMTAKMEVTKEVDGNTIMQDTNKDGSPRYYSYGTTFFNYGLAPQTWEDPTMMDVETGQYGGDNDPIDIIELGDTPLEMGSVTPCKVIGELELIDEGETDHKILCLALTYDKVDKVNTMEDLEQYKPGITDLLRDWLKRYKTSDGKPENSLANGEKPRTPTQALEILDEVHTRWRSLCGLDGTRRSELPSSTNDFWLASKSCRGRGSGSSTGSTTSSSSSSSTANTIQMIP